MPMTSPIFIISQGTSVSTSSRAMKGNLRFTFFFRNVVGLGVHARDAKGSRLASNLPEENSSWVDFFIIQRPNKEVEPLIIKVYALTTNNEAAMK